VYITKVKLGPSACLEASITNYRPAPCNIAEQQRPQLHRGGKTKYRRWRDVSQSVVRNCTWRQIL